MRPESLGGRGIKERKRGKKVVRKGGSMNGGKPDKGKKTADRYKSFLVGVELDTWFERGRGTNFE